MCFQRLKRRILANLIKQCQIINKIPYVFNLQYSDSCIANEALFRLLTFPQYHTTYSPTWLSAPLRKSTENGSHTPDPSFSPPTYLLACAGLLPVFFSLKILTYACFLPHKTPPSHKNFQIFTLQQQENSSHFSFFYSNFSFLSSFSCVSAVFLVYPTFRQPVILPYQQALGHGQHFH